MKLYTEEQVRKIQQAILSNYKDAIMDEDYFLNVTTPIELPSDEEIEDVICPKCEGVNEYTISKDGNYRCAYTDCQYIFNRQINNEQQ